VALSYLLIPFRVDKGCEPSDLMRSERPRSTRTRSLKWTVLERGISIWWLGLKRRGPAHLARVLAWNRRRGRAGRVLWRGPVGSRWRRGHDDVQLDEVVSETWSVSRIVSRRGRGERLEVSRRRWALGSRWLAQSRANSSKTKTSGEAPGHCEEDRGEEEN
jgi:hypothetical protein